MSKKKKQRTHCKTTAYRDQRMQELRDILTARVPQRVREIIASGKANDEAWMIQRLEWAKSVDPDELFSQGRVEEWLEKMTEMFAILSFIPGGSTAALGVKLLGLELGSGSIENARSNQEEHSPARTEGCAASTIEPLPPIIK